MPYQAEAGAGSTGNKQGRGEFCDLVYRLASNYLLRQGEDIFSTNTAGGAVWLSDESLGLGQPGDLAPISI